MMRRRACDFVRDRRAILFLSMLLLSLVLPGARGAGDDFLDPEAFVISARALDAAASSRSRSTSPGCTTYIASSSSSRRRRA